MKRKWRSTRMRFYFLFAVALLGVLAVADVLFLARFF